MTDSTLETLFLRWRDRRDVDALADVFDRTAPALLRLARHLAPAGVEGEDLLQTTFLAALESPEGWDAGRPLAPWLAGVLGRRALQERRRRARTPDPERLSTPLPDDPGRAAAATETRELVSAALQRLPDRYRSLLEGRLLQERGWPELATELDRAPATVHVQGHRGLRLLRRLLPAGLAPDAAGAAGGEHRLATVRRAVLRAADRRAGALAAGLPGALPILVPLAGVALLAVLGASLFSRHASSEPDFLDAELPPEIARSVDGVVLDTPARLASRAAGATEDLPNEAAAADADVAEAGGESAEDPEDSEEVPIRWWIVGRVLAPPNIDHGELAHDGTKVRAAGPGVGMEFGVVRADGNFRAPMLSTPPWEQAVEAELPETERKMTFTVTHPDHLPGRVEVGFDERYGDTISVELELRPAGRVRGAARDTAGADLPACYVQVYPLVGGRLEAPAIADRGFERPSSYDLLAAPGDSVAVVGLGGSRPAGARTLVLEGATRTLETVVLEGGATLRGRASEPFEVGALVEATLLAAPSAQPLGPLAVTWYRGRVEWAVVKATVGSDGRFELRGLAPGERYRVTLGDREAVAVAGAADVVL